MKEETPELSVVAPMHNEEGNVRALFDAVVHALEPLGRPFEVVLVNDGSTDATPQLLDALAASDERLRPVHLERNFGEAAAFCAGIETARGRYILTMDGDLQNDPADFPRLLALLESGDYLAVSGWRRKRKEGFATRVLPSKIANWLIARVSGLPTKDNGCSIKVYRTEVVKGVHLPHGLHRFVPAVFGVRAHQFAQTEVNDRPRYSGRSHYGMSRFFAVIRDVLAVPYILSDPKRGAERMRLLFGASLALLAGGSAVAAVGQVGAGAGIAIGAGLLGAYSSCVRKNLQRWLRAQCDKPFRIRSGAGDRTRALGEAELSRGEVRA